MTSSRSSNLTPIQTASVNVKLSGVKSAAHLLDLESIHDATSNQFFWLRIDDEFRCYVSQIDASEYPEDFVIGQYAAS